MTTSLGFTSADFRLEAASAVAPAMVRVRFTTDPKQIAPSEADDGLNAINYQLAGPASALVVGVNSVVGDPQSLDLFLSTALVGGSYTLLVLGVVAEDGGALQGANTILFDVSATAPQDLVNGGAQDASIEQMIKEYMGSALVGENWSALVYALSIGDAYVAEQARNLYDQLFLVSSDGRYLDRLAGEKGVRRPDGVGMSDELFRELAIQMSTEKVTYAALWRLLEIFYGPAAVRGAIETESDEPYAIQDQTQLILEFDGTGVRIPVTFRNSDFSQLGSSRAIEVAAVISRQIRQLGISGWAQAVLNPLTQRYRVQVFSPSLGMASKVRVVGGLAQNKLRFPTVIDVALTIGDSFSVSVPTLGTAVYSITGLTDPILSSVQIGDYVNISASALNAANKGSFIVTDVSIVWGGAAYTQSFSVTNQQAVIQSGPLLTTADDDFVFFRAGVGAIPSSQALVSGAIDGQIIMELPASTAIVSRAPYRASYLQGSAPVSIATAALSTDGVLSVTTESAHGLTVGQHVMIDGLAPNVLTSPITAGIPSTAGNPGTTASSQMTIQDTIRTPDSFAARWGHSLTVMPNGRVLMVGGETASGTYSAGATSLVVTGSVLNPDGRLAYTYNYADVADPTTPVARHAAVALNKRVGPAVLRICGQTTADAPTATIEMYNQTLNTWAPVTNGIHPACWYLLAIPVVDASGDDVVILSGGQTGAATGTATTSRIGTSTGTPLLAGGPSDSAIRARHAGCAIDANRALWAGGNNPAASTVPHASTFVVDYLGAVTPSGPLAVARYDHKIVSIGNGQALAIGGLGRVLSRETVNRAVHEVELFSFSTRSWTHYGRLQTARIQPQVAVVGQKVYVFGGWTSTGGATASTTEVLDLATGRWSVLPTVGNATVQVQAASVVLPGALFTFGGLTSFVVAVGTAQMIVLGSDFVTGRHHLNRTLKVSGVSSGVDFTVAGLPTGDNLRTSPGASGAQVTKVSAPAVSTPIGPYIWNPTGDPALTNVSAEVQVAIPIHAQVGVLDVDDATEFPDQPGWLAFNAGYSNQVSPVRYLGRISDTQLALDFEHRFEQEIEVGSTVELLVGKGALDTGDVADLGSAYITDSSAGRIAAERFIRDAVMCGPELNIIVKYPSDYGLGNGGSPYTGFRKLSDAIRVWGGNELTAETEVAVEEVSFNE